MAKGARRAGGGARQGRGEGNGLTSALLRSIGCPGDGKTTLGASCAIGRSRLPLCTDSSREVAPLAKAKACQGWAAGMPRVRGTQEQVRARVPAALRGASSWRAGGQGDREWEGGKAPATVAHR